MKTTAFIIIWLLFSVTIGSSQEISISEFGQLSNEEFKTLKAHNDIVSKLNG